MTNQELEYQAQLQGELATLRLQVAAYEAKLNSAEPVAWKGHSGHLVYDKKSLLPSTREFATPLYEHPPAPISVTCQIYGHVVGACDECNTHAENDVNETNKILADNYLKLTCGNPAPSASSRHFKQMESQLAQLTAERDSLKAPLDAVAKVASDAEKLVISQRDEIAKIERLMDIESEMLMIGVERAKNQFQDEINSQAAEIAELREMAENVGNLHSVTLDEYSKLKALCNQMGNALEKIKADAGNPERVWRLSKEALEAWRAMK